MNLAISHNQLTVIYQMTEVNRLTEILLKGLKLLKLAFPDCSTFKFEGS